MAISLLGLKSHASYALSQRCSIPALWDLDDERILLDIETDRRLRLSIEAQLKKPTQRIHYFLLEGRTLGPLSVLLILALYSLLSPLLSPAIHEYIYHILH